MSRIEIKMPGGEGIAAGQTATFKIPVGRRYHEMLLEGAATAFNVAQLSELRVLLNNKVVQRYTGTERDLINQFDGCLAGDINAGAFALRIPFDRHFLNTAAAEEETAINTGSLNEKTGEIINSFNIEVDLASAGITGTPALVLSGSVSESLPGGPGTVLHIRRSTRSVGAAGDFNYSDAPRGGKTTLALNRIIFDPSANNITNVVIEADQKKLFDRTAARNRLIQRNGVRVPQADWYVIDRTERGLGGDPIDLRNLQDYRYTITTDGAMTLVTLEEYLGGLGD